MRDGEQASILIVDDDSRVRTFLKNLLESKGYKVMWATDGQQALDRVEENRPDLVLLDVIMPRLGGLDVLRVLKSPEERQFLPVILLTGDTDLETRLQGLKLGADDYLIKPADSREVLARIEALLRIKRLQDQIAGSRRELEDNSLLDPVTGLHNAQYLKIRLADEFKRAERYNEPLSCILLCVENIIGLRKERGEQFDEWFKGLAGVIRAGVREFDLVVRERDDRFVILLPRTHFAGSMAVASRIWTSVRTCRSHWTGQAGQLELSTGVAFYPDRDVTTQDQLIDKVERALDKARGEGLGYICLYQQTAYFFKPDHEH